MFTESPIETKLDAEIISLLGKLKETTKDTEEYEKLIKRTSELHKLKVEERQLSTQAQNLEYQQESDNRPKRISPDTALVVAANIFGILWLTRFERENVIKAPNALKFVMKPR